MSISFIIAGCMVGSTIGSFLATLLIRWPKGQSVTAGRSSCDTCGRQLRVLDLVPILSHLLLSGKCRTCGKPIAQDHLAIELLAALMGGLSFALFDLLLALATAILGWLLLILAALDAKHFWLPNQLTGALFIAGVGTTASGLGLDLATALIGAVGGFMFLWIVALLYQRVRHQDGLGGGDAKLFGAIGAWVGWWPLPYILLAAAGLGLTAAFVLKLAGRPMKRMDKMPFGALLALAAWPAWIALQLGLI